ncbi:hypothetical protein P7C70_g6698, partial [Phenoliferia sp. Uapishka_3]
MHTIGNRVPKALSASSRSAGARLSSAPSTALPHLVPRRPVQVVDRALVDCITARQLATHANASSSTLPTSSHAHKPLFNKILIANRGEIACRVIRTAQSLGIKCVAVFSEADRHSLHVRLADEAYLIGPPLASESYLRADKILEVCKRSGAQAVHPGYGFLSENAAFSKMLKDEGIVFIGPPASAIIMLRAGVPCVPGWHPSSSSSPTAQEPSSLILEANKIGYPVLIKAVSGGGGKGMKIVMHREEFNQQLESAKREAMKGFGDDTVSPAGEISGDTSTFVPRSLRTLLLTALDPHPDVEVQIFSDTQGNHVSLFERDCSVQRRHQKIIEEAPAPGLNQGLREQLYDMARKAAKAVNYVGAGTVEFIMDANDPSKFFFMEMNTRLQVEHPVTEAITGVDLVQWQLEVAAGNPIPLSQSEIKRTGHAFECRIYAENPRNNFLPETGLLRHVRPPTTSSTVRMETGFGTGDEISVFYDPLIAKLIVHGSDRTEALRVLRKALDEYQVVGPHTNIEFLKSLAKHEAFIAGEVETGFIPKHHEALFAPSATASPSVLAQAGVFLALRDLSTSKQPESQKTPWSSPALAGYRIGPGTTSPSTFQHSFTFNSTSADSDQTATVSIGSPAFGSFDFPVHVVDFGGNVTEFPTVSPLAEMNAAGASMKALLGDQMSQVDIVAHAEGGNGKETLSLFSTREQFVGEVEVRGPKWLETIKGEKKAAPGSAKAPMPSRIVQIFVKKGDVVDAGTPLVMVEAMKTEHVLRAPKDGVVSRVIATVGELVPEGKVLVEFVEENAVQA